MTSINDMLRNEIECGESENKRKKDNDKTNPIHSFLQKGALGDCYFLGALSVIATRADLLEPLFVHKSPECGFYQVK
jgi:hypothetical protein